MALAFNTRGSLMFDLTRRHMFGLLGGAAVGPAFFSKLANAQGAKIKTLVGCIEEEPPIMNPAISTVISGLVTAMPTHSNLLTFDPRGKPYPDLAETWELLPDNVSYKFNLRKDVVFHDGKPLSSADAKFTIEEMIAKIHPSARGAYKSLDKVEAPDPHTLIVRMKKPTASYLGIPTAFGPILPKHLWEGTDIMRNPLNKKPIGAGPYKLVDHVVNDHFRYVRNDKFYIPGQPAFDELIIRIIPDAAARLAAFQVGEVDFLYPTAVPSTEIARMIAMSGVKSYATPLGGGCWVGNINIRNSPYSDKRVRHALAHAIDRKFIRDNVLPGISENQVGPLPPSSPLYSGSLKDYEFDPRKAIALLDEAGFKPRADGTRFDFRFLWAPGDIRVTRIGDVIARNLAAVGIKPILRPLERSVLNQLGYIGGEFDMIVDSFALGPDPDVGVERLYRSDNMLPMAFVNNSGYSNPEIDKLFEEQRSQTDFAKRKAIYDKISAILWDDLPVFPVCAYTGPAVYRSTVVQDIFVTDNTNRTNLAAAKPTKS